MKNKIKSRENILIQSDTSSLFIIPLRETFFYLLFLLLPASIYGCSSLEVTDNSSAPPDKSEKAYLKSSMTIGDNISSLDIFSFNDDALERLDSYQRFDKGEFSDNQCRIGTSAGKKRVIILANAPFDRYEWADINCSNALDKKIFDLEDEDPDYPLMMGDYRIVAGETFHPEMEAMTGEVILRSLRCNFSDRSYSGEKLTDIKVYLTNVSASCGIWKHEDGAPSRIINTGKLNLDDIRGFSFPQLIYQTYDSPVGDEIEYPEIHLRGFDSCHQEESIGTPFTRLVIEGKLKGHTYYYPIAVNRGSETESSGFRRNTRYIYDITITRTGLTDPDGIIYEDPFNIDLTIEKWQEKDWYDIRF